MSDNIEINFMTADALGCALESITEENAKQCFDVFNKKVIYDKKTKYGIGVIDELNNIKTAKQFYTKLKKLATGEAIQTFLLVWAYSNDVVGTVFENVKLGDIEKYAMEKNFNGELRKNNTIEKTIDVLTEFYFTFGDDNVKRKILNLKKEIKNGVVYYSGYLDGITPLEKQEEV